MFSNEDGIAFLAGRWDGRDRREDENRSTRMFVETAHFLIHRCQMRAALTQAGLVADEEWDESEYDFTVGPFASEIEA